MCRRKGTLSIILILLFSALLSASTALVFFLTRGSAAAVSHEEGLRSVYAAESGANWALSRLSSGAGGSTALTLEEGDRTILVRITDDGESGRIKVRSENEKGDHRRFLTIDFSSETVDGKRILTVEDISSVPF
ncbi:hypothetical protein [Dialister hominis]|jgi:hypothetical protein|uniref:Uncharacterized protein n=1 Tax=Dialister hominis TaxID=2582419 RepID=A0A8D4UVL6_9FIRM|nr:hypothetical protein [Dialister hominis]UYJ17641.1 MAG: hypothetical protein OGM58_04160 [Veillonellaceae bacterium]BBK25782.1 hypothetical protein Dia5BBH33_17170 [Dialister hominis]